MHCIHESIKNRLRACAQKIKRGLSFSMIISTIVWYAGKSSYSFPSDLRSLIRRDECLTFNDIFSRHRPEENQRPSSVRVRSREERDK